MLSEAISQNYSERESNQAEDRT